MLVYVMEREYLFPTLVIALGITSMILHFFLFERLESVLLMAILLILGIWTIIDFLKGVTGASEEIVRVLMIFVGGVLLYFGLHLECILLMVMFGTAELIEERVKELAEHGLRKTLELMPRVVRVIEGEVVAMKDVGDVKAGDVVVVGRGERIPVDGVVVEGEALVDESAITGEPEPRSIGIFNEVIAGGLVLSGALRVRARVSGPESTLAQIVKLAERYKERKARIESIVHKFSRIYLSMMLVLAAVVWVTLGYYKALIVLAVGCPSAYLVAIPATLLLSLSVYARRGIVVKGTRPIEAASKVKVMALDKTGTLTLGDLFLEKIVILDGRFTENNVLAYAASLEVHSTHPIARAVLREARRRKIRLLKISDVMEVPAVGIQGKTLDGRRIFLGKLDIMRVKEHLPVEYTEIEGKTIVQLSVDDRIAALMVFSDRLNPKAKSMIKELKKLGLRILLLTGDKISNAKAVADALEITEFYAGLLPEDKVRIIEELKSVYRGRVAMVGDGINDAPALAASDVGIAIGSLEVAGESGDFVVPAQRIRNVPFIIKFSRRCMRAVMENISIILVTKIIALVLGLLGLLPLWLSVAVGDDGGVLLALLNTIKILRAPMIFSSKS